MIRLACLALVLLAFDARADLYRWIDPETGSVKFSTLQPEDPRIRAELIPYKGPAAPPAPAPGPAAAPAAPQENVFGALQARWADLLGKLAGLQPQDFGRAGAGLRQQLDAYEAVSNELDRLDPAGAQRRRAQAETLLERLKRGLAAQFSPTSPVQQKK